jgi:ribosomal protein S18 acetylase RimI-like enzyme
MIDVSRLGVAIASPTERLADAAEIWAEATAARDQDTEVAPVDLARSVIERALGNSADSFVLLAVNDGGRALGFAAVAPDTGCRDRFELYYLGVRPEAWGQGVAVRLLSALREELFHRGCAEAQLWVYCDNHRAVGLYRRMGWQRTRDTRTHPRSRRREARYTLRVGSRP